MDEISAIQKKQGMLYLCATPIGNLEDITLRVLRILKEADIIAAEDTRNSIRLLRYYNIETPMTSYHEHNKYDKARTLIERMKKGESVALITDAGTPAISDPGEDIVRMCIDEGINVTSLPGAVAGVTALTLSGLSTRRFAFEAFLPSDKKLRKKIIEELREETRTIIIYEAPHHLLSTLKQLSNELGQGRKVSVVKELTKIHEFVLRDDLKAACEYFEENIPRGEYVIVIDGVTFDEKKQQEIKDWQQISVEEHLSIYTNKGDDKKTAMKKVAADRGVSKSVIYRELLK